MEETEEQKCGQSKGGPKVGEQGGEGNEVSE